mgnify:CR=1 FL=1
MKSGSKKKNKKKDKEGMRLSTAENARLKELLDLAQMASPDSLTAETGGPEMAQALIEKLAQNDSPRLETIAALAEAYPEKAVRKALRRAVFQMERRGIPVDSLQENAALRPEPALKARVENDLHARIGPVMDLSGARLVVVTAIHPLKGHEVLIAVVSPEKGFLDIFAGRVNRKQLTRLEKDMEAEGQPMVDTSLVHSADVLEKAYQQHIRMNAGAPDGYLAIRPSLLERAARSKSPAIEEAPVASTEPFQPPTQAQCDLLFRETCMERWLIEVDLLQPYLEEMRSAVESPLVLSAMSQADRLADIRGRALSGIFTGANMDSLRDCLAENAFVFKGIGKEDAAKTSLQAAQECVRFRDAPDGSVFLRYLLDRSLAQAGGVDVGRPPEEDLREENEMEKPLILV